MKPLAFVVLKIFASVIGDANKKEFPASIMSSYQSEMVNTAKLVASSVSLVLRNHSRSAPDLIRNCSAIFHDRKRVEDSVCFSPSSGRASEGRPTGVISTSKTVWLIECIKNLFFTIAPHCRHTGISGRVSRTICRSRIRCRVRGKSQMNSSEWVFKTTSHEVLSTRARTYSKPRPPIACNPVDRANQLAPC